jgi:hypothetical protein
MKTIAYIVAGPKSESNPYHYNDRLRHIVAEESHRIYRITTTAFWASLGALPVVLVIAVAMKWLLSQ